MKKKFTLNLDSELLSSTAKQFGYKNNKDYSELVKGVFLYFIQSNQHKNKKTAVQLKINNLLKEPNNKTVIENYNFNIGSVEGKLPGDEIVEQLINML